jgi:hypothetical protein
MHILHRYLSAKKKQKSLFHKMSVRNTLSLICGQLRQFKLSTVAIGPSEDPKKLDIARVE